MVENLIDDIADMDQGRYTEFARYFTGVVDDFMTQRYEGLEEAHSNIERLSEQGGNAIIIGELEVLLMDAESPGEYAEDNKGLYRGLDLLGHRSDYGRSR